MSQIYYSFEKFFEDLLEKNGCLTIIVVLIGGGYFVDKLYEFLVDFFPVLIIFVPLLYVLIHFYLLGDTRKRTESQLSFSIPLIFLIYLFLFMILIEVGQYEEYPPEQNPIIHFLYFLPDWLPFWEDVRFNYTENGYFGKYDFNYYGLDWVYDYFPPSIFIFHIIILTILLYIRYWFIKLKKTLKNHSNPNRNPL